MTIRTELITVTVAGVAGSAAGDTTSNSPLNGELLALYIDDTAGAATADITITTPNAPIKTLFTRTDSAADGWYYPRYIPHGPTGTALTATAGGDNVKHPLNDHVKVAVAQSDAGSVKVYVVYEGE